MEIESLFGLPAHPLVVHAAVVLLPLAALAVLATALVPRWRRAYAPLALALALAATVAVGLAQGSGEALEDDVDETELVEAHAGEGERVLPWAIGLTVVAIGVAAADPLARRGKGPPARTVTVVLVVLALVSATGATVMVADVGHSGAKAAWDDVEANGDQGEDGDREGDREDDDGD